jgi:Domain of unknown function (4846)
MAMPRPTRPAGIAAIALLLLTLASPAAIAERRYLWPGASETASGTIADRIAPPDGFSRVAVKNGSFADWLRHLPLRPPQTPVRLYDGRLKWSQDKHVAVVAIDTGTKNLQQCADAIMRLRAEYLLASGRPRDIAFNYTDGKRVAYRGRADDRKAFQRYMIQIFSYAGSYSLEREMRPVPLSDMAAGDVFIQGGFPGHAVLVADLVEIPSTGERRFLLLQSYMPAQDMHLLKNPKAADGTPWYSVPGPKDELITPEWVFKPNTLRRFREEP